MLNPDLYDNDFVANFIDSLLEPEIDTVSTANLASLKQHFMATDDIGSLTGTLMEEAKKRILTTGTLPPHFTSFSDKDHKITFELEQDIPTKHEHIKQFLCAGKSLAMIRSAQCIFFSTLQPLCDDHPAIGEKVDDTCSWGVLLIGSSLRGNCFIHIHRMMRDVENIHFELVRESILREGQFPNYPFSQFFHIKDEEEMSNIIAQIPKLMLSSGLSESECLVNFATTLKALQYFSYPE